MIAFNTTRYELFNHIIHHFLELEVFSDENGLEDIIDVLPEHLVREQYHKCKSVFEELYKWTNDKSFHEMTAFHEVALYYFLSYMSDLQNDFENFNDLYFDKKIKKYMKEASIQDFRENNEFSPTDYMNFYYDIFDYSDYLLSDTDFLQLDKIYNELSMGSTFLADQFGINIDYYFELLPMDIQQKYKSNHINLFSEISAFLDFIDDKVENGSLYKLFWSNNSPVTLQRIQLIFDNLINSYYHNHDIELLWKSIIKNRYLDFEFCKSRNKEEKVLIEIKRAGSYLTEGFEKYLLNHSRLYKVVFYLIICFTDEEYKQTIDFINKYVYTGTVTLYVNIQVLNMRKRDTASKIRKSKIEKRIKSKKSGNYKM